MAFTINVNGTVRAVNVYSDTPLLWILRELKPAQGREASRE